MKSQSLVDHPQILLAIGKLLGGGTHRKYELMDDTLKRIFFGVLLAGDGAV